jgi:hypothetical protein
MLPTPYTTGMKAIRFIAVSKTVFSIISGILQKYKNFILITQ